MLEKIKEILVSTSNVDANLVKEDASLKEDLGIDSLDAVEIVMAIESEFDITIEDEEMANLVTVGDIIKVIESKKN